MVHPSKQKDLTKNTTDTMETKKKLFVVFDLNGTLMAHTYASPGGEPMPKPEDARAVPGLQCMCTPKGSSATDNEQAGSGVVAHTSMFDDVKQNTAVNDGVDSDDDNEDASKKAVSAPAAPPLATLQHASTAAAHEKPSKKSPCSFDYSPVAYGYTMVHKRPHLCALFDWVFEHCEVAVWTYSGMTQKEATALAKATFGSHFDKIAAVFSRSDRPSCKRKDLGVVWRKLPHWVPRHTVLVDDSLQKMHPSQSANFVSIDTYSKRHFALDVSLVRLKEELQRRLAIAEADPDSKQSNALPAPSSGTVDQSSEQDLSQSLSQQIGAQGVGAAAVTGKRHLLFFAPRKDTQMVNRLTPSLSSFFTIHHYWTAQECVRAINTSGIEYSAMLSKLGTRGNLGVDVMKALRDKQGKKAVIVVHSATANQNAQTRAQLYKDFGVASFVHEPTERTVLLTTLADAAIAH